MPAEIVTVTGTDFHDGLSVLFGEVASPEVVFDESSDPTRIEAEVPGRREFSITTGGGRDFSVSDVETRIEGLGWVDVSMVQMNDTAAKLVWTSEVRWRTEVPLERGANELVFVAFDADGNVVGSDTITVTSTGGSDAPSITSVEPEAAMPEGIVTITGTEFHDGLSVLFGGVASPEVEFDESSDPTKIEAEVPLLPPGAVDVTVVNVDERSSAPVSLTVRPLPAQFVRGDFNLDGAVEIADAMKILVHLFNGVGVTCADAGDVNDDEILSASDAIQLLEYLYRDGDPPQAPFPTPGWELEAEGPLGCEKGLR